jgi:hypothetical protein
MRNGKWISIATVLMMAAGAIVLPPAGADGRGSPPNADSEPNNSFADATVVSPSGSSISFGGTCSDTDVNDYYKIQLTCNPPQSEKLTVTTSCSDGIKRLFIYDPLGNDILLDGDANQYNDHSISTVAFTTGYYYVRYEVQGLSASASYTIRFTKSTATYNGQNNTPATATPVTAFPATQNGAVDDPAEQADWFRLDLVNNLTSADVVTFSCQPSANLAARVEVYFLNLTYIDQFLHYEIVDNNDTTPGAKDDKSFGAPVNGTFYLRVLAVKGAGTYTLKIWKLTVDKDDWNSADTAMGLPAAEGGHYLQFEDTLGKDVDREDFFVFQASEGQIINATLWSLDFDSAQDRPQISIELRDSTNTYYGSSTGIAKPVGRADGVSPETTTTSYLRVSLANYQGGAGRYRVNITMNMPPTIFEGKWETPFTVNESSFGSLDLSTVFYDADFDTLTYTAVNNAGGKTLVKFKDNEANFSAELQPGWTGKENWTVTARDPFGYTASANIHVNVVAVNHAPYLVRFEMPDISCYPGDKLFTSINLNLNMTDYFADDDIYNIALEDYLTYNAANFEPLNITFQLIPGTLKHSGGLTINVPEMPDLIAPLTIAVTFWATDALGLETKLLTCNITVNPPVNHAPRWSANFTQIEMNESTAGSPSETVVNLNDYCTDADSWDKGLLVYTAKGYNTNGLSVTITNGYAKIVPKPGFYTTPPHENLTFNATDTKFLSAEATIKVVVKHVYYRPNITDWKPATFNVNVNEGEQLNFTVTVLIDPVIAGLTPAPVKYRWYVNGTIQTATTGNFTFRTDYTTASRSPFNITFQFNDSVTEVQKHWRVTVLNVNQPPANVKIVSPAWPRLNFTSGDKITFQAAQASDPDDPNATLTYEWRDAGSPIGTGPTFGTSRLTVGTHKIILVVTDAEGAEATDNVTIRVKAKPPSGGLPGMELVAALGALGLAAAAAVFTRRRR